MEESSTVQLIYIGNECKLADPQNSEIPDWPVEDQGGHWHRSAFVGQRAAFGQNSVEFGFLARLMDEKEVSGLNITNLPGDVFYADGQYYKQVNNKNHNHEGEMK